MTLPKPILLATLATFGLAAQTAVLMNPYDAFTTGATTRETTLTAANVGGARFGKLYTYCVDGAVYAQPRYVPGLRNVLCIATMTDKVYVFDADKPGPPLWLRDLTNELAGGRDLAGPAYWDGDGGPAIYLWTEADVLKAFRFDGSRLDPTPFAKGDLPSKGSPGGALTISSDGKKAGTGIVWAMLTNGKSADHGNAPGILYAYDAETLHPLWNSERKPKRDRLGTLVKFVPPVVAGGRVYAPNYDNAVNVYGVLP